MDCIEDLIRLGDFLGRESIRTKSNKERIDNTKKYISSLDPYFIQMVKNRDDDSTFSSRIHGEVIYKVLQNSIENGVANEAKLGIELSSVSECDDACDMALLLLNALI